MTRSPPVCKAQPCSCLEHSRLSIRFGLDSQLNCTNGLSRPKINLQLVRRIGSDRP